MRKTVIGADVGSDLDLFDGVDGVNGLPHSEAVAVDLPGYRRVFVSGTAAIDERGDVVAPGDAAAQAEHIYGTLSELLGTAGGGLADIVRLRLITEPLTEAEYLEVVKVRQRYLEP
ncbi:MAG: Rid family hydrolase, partial [Halobacteriales archaeon]